MGQLPGPRRAEEVPGPLFPSPRRARLARRPPLPGSRRTEASTPTPCRPTPVPKSSGQERRQLPRAGKLETYLPRMRYTINGGVFVRLPGKWGTGREARGAGDRRARAEEGPAAGTGPGAAGGFPPVTSGTVSTSSLLLARPVLQKREPRIMSGFVFLRARGSLRMMVIFFFLNQERK